MKNFKICSHVLVFNQDLDILNKYITMIGEAGIEKLYLSYSEQPWNAYNSNARNLYKNNFSPDQLINHKYYNIISFRKGLFSLEEEQRNDCAKAAREEGFTHLLVMDCDEFYKIQALKDIIETIKQNPDYDVYLAPWISYWKDLQHIVVDQNDNPIIGYPEVCMNLTTGVNFVRCRRPDARTSYKLSSLCHHLSYVLSDEQCWMKINVWGHSHQFNKDQWYKDKWLNWNENTTDLHPIDPPCWKRAIISTFELPEILKKLK